MNEKIPVENKTAMPMYVGGLMIPPGETRHFDAHQVPAHLLPTAPKVIEEPAPDPLLAILLGAVAAVMIGLPTLTDEELDRLAALETEGKNRKGVLGGIAAEKLVRAKKAAEAEALAAGANPATAQPGETSDGGAPTGAGAAVDPEGGAQ